MRWFRLQAAGGSIKYTVAAVALFNALAVQLLGRSCISCHNELCVSYVCELVLLHSSLSTTPQTTAATVGICSNHLRRGVVLE